MTDLVDNPPPGTDRADELEAVACPLTDRILHDASATTVRCLPDERILTSGWDGHFRVWDRHSGEAIHEVDLGFAKVDLLGLAPHESLSVFGVQRNLEVHDLSAASVYESFPTRQTDAPIHSAAFHPDGDLLITGSQNKVIDVWDLGSGAHIDSMKGHRRTISAIGILASNALLVSAGLDGDIRTWDLNQGALRTQRWLGQSPLTSLCQLDDAGLFAAGDANGDVMIWNATTDEVDRRIHAHSGPINDIASRDVDCLATVSSDGELRTWDVISGELIAWHDAGIPLHSCTYDGEHLLVAADDGRVTRLTEPNP